MGEDMLFSFKYKGTHITTYWQVNGTYNLSDVFYIRKIMHYSTDDLRCEETHDLILKQVTHSYSGNFTAFACRGAFYDSAPNVTVNLS